MTIPSDTQRQCLFPQNCGREVCDCPAAPAHSDPVARTVADPNRSFREDALVAEIGALRAELAEAHRIRAQDGEAKAPEVYLKHAGPARDGSFMFEFTSDVVPIIASHLVEQFKAVGGKNYVSFEIEHTELGPLILKMQRRNGETPEQQNAALRAELAEAHRVHALNRAELVAALDALTDRHETELRVTADDADHARARALEEAAAACEAEVVDEHATQETEDMAYNLAIEHCVAAIRALAKDGGK